MRGPSRKLTTDEQLYAAALRALMRRAHSVHEMRAYLERRAEDAASARRVLGRLKAERLLDDTRYAHEFARFHSASRRQGRYRIARELRRRGVADRHIEVALEQALAEVDEGELVRQRLERKLRHWGASGSHRLDNRKLASLQRSLLRAGFSADTIRAEFRAFFRRAIELPDVPPEEGE